MRSQVAAEYLIIVAIVIALAVLVAGILGGLPVFQGDVSEATVRVALQSAPIGVVGYVVSDYNTILTIRNNHQNTVELDEVFVNHNKCLFFYDETIRLHKGEKKDIVCQNVFEFDEGTVSFPILINWTDQITGATYLQQQDEYQLVGRVANTYLATLLNNRYWNDSIDGCYNDLIDPIPLCTCLDLNKTRINLDANYSLQNSIDFDRCSKQFGVDFVSEDGWEPIGDCKGGTCYDSGNAYSGIFDGNKNLISNLRMQRSDGEPAGLFGLIQNASIINLGLVNVVVNQTSDASIGGIVGYVNLSIVMDNVYVQGIIDSNHSRSGGLIGSGFYYLYLYNSIIVDSYVKGEVKGLDSVGGLVGEGRLPISYSFFEGRIIGSGSRVGGLAGWLEGDVSNVYVNAIVSGSSNVGGLVGHFDTGTMDNSGMQGAVSGINSVGGLIGLIRDYNNVENSYSDAIISGQTRVGGLIGDGYEAGDIDNSYSSSEVYCTSDYCGGLVGYLNWPLNFISSTWSNYTTDNATGCVGRAGSTGGAFASGCLP